MKAWICASFINSAAMRQPHARFFHVLLHIAAWIPLLVLIYQFQSNNLTANPIQAATQRMGNTALVLLILSLACTPVYALFRFAPALKARRPLGLYAYMYATIHLFIFFGLDYGFNLRFVLLDFAEKRFIIVGLAAFLILSALALTSYRWWMVRLGKRWKRLHRLVYLANVLVVLHFAWAIKGDFFRLQGDVLRPLLAAIAVLGLLLLRVPTVRKWLRDRITGQ